jgi:hypothetical protein
MENAHWIIEVYWQANEGMMKRASTFVGLLGIELGVLGALDKKNFPDLTCFIYALILAGALIVLSIGIRICLARVLKSGILNTLQTHILEYQSSHPQQH